MVRVLFVCLGNVCRSPMAHGLFHQMLERAGASHVVEVDSAGTHTFHIGRAPDPRAQACALRRGVDLSVLQARRLDVLDFEEFDYLVAMDRENLQHLLAIAPPAHQHKIHLFLEFAPELHEDEIPDPYFGGPSGFERVLDLIEEGSRGLLEHLQAVHRATR